MTGVAGFIGSHLAEALLAKGCKVIGVDCLTDYYPSAAKMGNIAAFKHARNFQFVRKNIATSNLRGLLHRGDYIFHLAAQPGVRSSWGSEFQYYVRDNIVATQQLLEVAKKEMPARLVFASSSSIYGDAEAVPTPESTPPKPNSPYGVTKLAGEGLCRVYQKNFDLPTVCLRYFTVYGPRQRPDMAFHRFIKAILHGKPIVINGTGTQSRDFTFVDDIVRGTIRSVSAVPGTTYNIASGRTIALNSIVSLLRAATHKEVITNRKAPAVGDVYSTSADISKAEQDLGYKPRVSIRDGLQKQIDWQLGTAIR